MTEDPYKEIRPTEDEFTAKMHNELKVSKETEKKHVVWSVIGVTNLGIGTLEKNLKSYNITKSDYDKYKHSFPGEIVFSHSL